MNPLQAHDHSRLEGRSCLLGVDEAGRGCLAGPVVAAACLVKPDLFLDTAALKKTSRVNDSKKLSAEARSLIFCDLKELAQSGLLELAVAQASVMEIDDLNILGATRLAMRRALERLESRGGGWGRKDRARILRVKDTEHLNLRRYTHAHTQTHSVFPRFLSHTTAQKKKVLTNKLRKGHHRLVRLLTLRQWVGLLPDYTLISASGSFFFPGDSTI